MNKKLIKWTHQIYRTRNKKLIKSLKKITHSYNKNKLNWMKHKKNVNEKENPFMFHKLINIVRKIPAVKSKWN